MPRLRLANIQPQLAPSLIKTRPVRTHSLCCSCAFYAQQSPYLGGRRELRKGFRGNYVRRGERAG